MDLISLYVSQFSQSSKIAVKVCNELGLNNLVNIVGIDNPETRKRIRYGKLFTITIVPTLVVEDDGGNIKLYQGTKSIQYMQHLAMEKSMSMRPVEENIVLPKSKKAKKKAKKRPKSKMLKKIEEIKSDDESETEDVEEILDDEYDEIEEIKDDAIEAVPEVPQPIGGVPQSGKVNINSIITQMQAQRTRELGYDEKNLPRF